MLLNLELVSKVKLCLVSAFADIVKDWPKLRTLPEILLRSFENVGPGVTETDSVHCYSQSLNNTHIPRSLKRSCFVATGALNIDRPSRLTTPSLAPTLTIARHRLALPLKYASSNTEQASSTDSSLVMN